jgi:hypothetical protein
LESMLELLSTGSNRAYVTTTNHETFLRALIGKTRENAPWSVVEEKIISDGRGFMFFSNSSFYEHFNKKLLQLVESGIANKIVEEEEERKLKKSKKRVNKEIEEEEKVKLSLSHLEPWFYALLILLSISVAVFLVELAVNRKSGK